MIVGGGPAGERCAVSLRARGYDGRLVLVCGEELPPYDRTLVSKDVLSDTPPSRDELMLQPDAAYSELGVDLRLGVRAVALEWRERRVRLDDGTVEPYDALVVATGGSASCPPPLAAPDVRALRALRDGESLARELVPGRRIAIVGGGFIGGEVASAACARGLEVTMVEALAAPLATALGPEAGARVGALHRSGGVELLTETPVETVRRAGTEYELRLAGGRRLRADVVVVGAGMRPAVEWLGSAPLLVDGAIATDASCRTPVPGIVAAGDCASWPHARYGTRVRVEHWDTARRHGEAAAGTVLGATEAFVPLPYFWSEQHGVRLQLVGRTQPADRVEIEDVDTPRAFVVRYFEGSSLTAVLAAGLPKVIAEGRRAILGQERPKQAVGA